MFERHQFWSHAMSSGHKRTSSRFNKDKKQTTMNCQNCGRQHEPCQCPAYGAVCHKCGKNNHFSKVCRAVGEKRDNSKAKTVNNIESEVDSLYIGMIGKNGKKNSKPHKGQQMV